MPYKIHNSHKTNLLQISPKLTPRYIHDFYKSAHNIQIHTIPSMISKLHFTCPFYFNLYYMLYFNIMY